MARDTPPQFVQFVLDQLSALGGVECRPMFGGYGLSHGDAFFGIIWRDQLYLKTDDATRDRYVSRGMQPFRPNARQTLKTYYEVPADVLEDRAELAQWARQSCEARGERRRGARR